MVCANQLMSSIILQWVMDVSIAKTAITKKEESTEPSIRGLKRRAILIKGVAALMITPGIMLTV